MNGEHAPVSPSSAGRIVKCPASRVLSQGQHWTDEYTDNTTRDEGIACHWAAEQYARTGIMPEIGTIAPAVGVAIDAEMQVVARAFIDGCVIAGCTVYEQRVTVSAIPDCWGTLDAGGALPDGALFIADLKYGFRPVDVWPNFQLALYAYGLAEHFGYTSPGATLRIYQPRAYHPQGPCRDIYVPWSEILRAVQTVAWAVANPDTATPGEHCAHCPGRVRCNALRETASAGIHALVEELSLSVIEREMQHLDRISAVVSAYHDALHLQFRRALKQGERPTKYELFKTTGTQAWSDPAAAQRVAAAMGKSLTTEKILSPAQARAVIGKDAVDALTMRKEGATKIVPQSAQSWAGVFKR